MLLNERVAHLRRLHPRISPHGQLYKHRSEIRDYYQVRLWTLFVSNENTHLIRGHVFKKSHPMSPSQWSQWFGEHLTDIHKNAVLPGIAVRTNKQWSVQRIYGWVGDDGAEHETNSPAPRRKRHKTKAKRRAHG